MKLFILTSRFPHPLEKGDKLRIFRQIRELSRYNDLVLCALTEEAVKREDFEVVEQYCSKIYILHRSKWLIFKNILKTFTKPMPMQVGYFFDAKLKKKIEKIIDKEKPDHLYCQLIRTAQYVRDLDYPKTLDYMDAFSVIARRWAKHATFPLNKLLEKEAQKITDFEKAVFDDFDRHSIISEQDKAQFNFRGSDQIEVIPNGVDLNFFHLIETAEKKYDLVFVGNMGYRPNVEAVKFLVKKALPLALRKCPELKVLIAGARPALEIKRLASRSVQVSGWVEDIRTAYASADIFVAPLFLGSGLQNKILEAMAMGIPCLTTQQVNNAIQAVPEESILIAESAEEFAKKMVLLKQSKDLRTKIRQNGLAFVRENYSWEIFGKQLNQLITREL